VGVRVDRTATRRRSQRRQPRTTPTAAITDRDIVVRCIADGGDPSSVTVEEYGGEKPVTVGADDSVEDALRTMIDHSVRRLPVIDGHDLIGMLSQADIAKNLPDGQTAQLVEAISGAPANN
ncbi:MAG: CBS domain-containing protein, partial [Nocardioidaceae bacterium]